MDLLILEYGRTVLPNLMRLRMPYILLASVFLLGGWGIYKEDKKESGRYVLRIVVGSVLCELAAAAGRHFLPGGLALKLETVFLIAESCLLSALIGAGIGLLLRLLRRA